MPTTLIRPTGQAKISVEEFRRMRAADVFQGRHIQLLDGELYEVGKNPPHNTAVIILAALLRQLLPLSSFHVREEKSVEPWEFWWPEPDVAVVRGQPADYWGRYPGPADVPLIAEVCDTSVQDRTKKLAGYAQAGFPVYWILDINRRTLEVYRLVAGSYILMACLFETESVDVVIDGAMHGQIAVADLLPPRE